MMSENRCPGCYDSFSGPWCDNCDQWPCRCVPQDAEEALDDWIDASGGYRILDEEAAR